MPQERVHNPHFDDDRVVWKDELAGTYHPVAYDQQFDQQWKMFLERKPGFYNHAGVETDDRWIDERIRELTGVRGYIESRKYTPVGYRLVRGWRGLRGRGDRRMGFGGATHLKPSFPVDSFRGKRCLDVGCGAGRWTNTLMALGASVKSVDPSESAVESTRRFNPDVERVNLFDILEQRADLHRAFDFTVCWGVIMHVHDPSLAFRNVAVTVKPGGQLYTMIYAPEGMHNSPTVLDQRKHYHTRLSTVEEKMAYAHQVSDQPRNVIGYLDMLNTFYNWVVPEEVIHGWYRESGFDEIVTLNAGEPSKCAFHVLGRKS